jgi:chitinase
MRLLLLVGCLPACWAQSVQPDTAASAPTKKATSFKVVGYFPQWGMFNTPAYNVKNVITSGTAPMLTHLIYAFSDIENNKCATYDAWADTLQPLPANQTVNGVADVEKPGVLAGNFHQLQEFKKLYPNVQIEISIGGGGMPPSKFSVASLPQNRAAFVASCIAMYIKGQYAPGIVQPGTFTGIDIDWEFPQTAADEANYIALLEEFRNQLNALGSGYTLTSNTGTSVGQWRWMNPDAAQNSVDFFNVSMYDFAGPWENSTGFTAPLTQSTVDPNPKNNADYVVRSLEGMGVVSSKIVFGMPLYGWHWTAVPATHNGLFQAGAADPDVYPYHRIAALTGYGVYRDTTTNEPWLYSAAARSFWTYDDTTSLEYKANYVAQKGLGGVMFWELSGDTADGAMIKAVVGSL